MRRNPDERLRNARRRWLSEPGDLTLQTEYFSQLLHAGYDGLSPEAQEVLEPVARQMLIVLEKSFQVESRPHSNLLYKIRYLKFGNEDHLLEDRIMGRDDLACILTVFPTRPGEVLISQYMAAYQTQNLWKLVCGFNSVDTIQPGHIGLGAVTSVSIYFTPYCLGIRKFGWQLLPSSFGPGWIPPVCPLDSLAEMEHRILLDEGVVNDLALGGPPIDLVTLNDGSLRVNNFGSLTYWEVPLQNAQDFWDLVQRLS